ncbi:MAG: DUF4291 domain-containing protein [Bacteroidota bacterium]
MNALLKFIPYEDYEVNLPQAGNWILGSEKDDKIIVYQAFNSAIANYATANQRFGGAAYSFSRMTWIKPNFLWMMHRSDWGTKPNQEHTLAIQIKKKGFLELLEHGVYSSYQERLYETEENWKQALSRSPVRIQWDPDHDPWGEKLSRRAIQIGIKGEQLERFNEEYICKIVDLSSFVESQRSLVSQKSSDFLIPVESVVDVPKILKIKFAI